MKSIRTILREHDIRPRKSYGQSFLEDINIIDKIARAAALKETETVVEIGSGLGVLTAMMAKRAAKVIALEIDPRLVTVLEEELQMYSNVEIVAEDVLRFDFRQAADETIDRKVKVVGNIPYNISSPIIFGLMDYRDSISEMVLMMQREVAERLSAVPGTKEYGIPTVLVNMYAQVSTILDVPPTCFFPPPRVHSQVIRISIRERPLTELTDEGFFTRLVKASFAQRRKTLFNNLKGSGLFGRDISTLESVLSAAGIDGGRRGETLTPEEFGRLSNITRELIKK
ncbi:MAG: 16S rRNA (adenine(1518)-N(6)/adenine(1519)-N(6))-dimethyltransferase RsmA [Smithellaceae bacterium]|nr:16S rRNA (adenine(1518)-N(6)/adenine(1519)-N(6))-dimethyltransferase RsmA [Smithellaceae bacterium]